MSPSWTKRYSLAPERMAGIAIGRNRICAVVLGEQGGKHEVPLIRTQEIAAPLFAAPPTAETEAMLANALQEASGEFRNLFAAVHIALPDTVIRSAVFELDELPKSADMRATLLSWRFAKEWQRPEDSLECRGFDLGADGGKRLLFGQAGDRAWLDCVRRALAQAGITPWSLNAASTYRFNRLHDAIAAEGGALLALNSDSWNLLLWDDAGRIRQVLTRMRGTAATESEAASIADEVERAILAYVQAGDGRRIGKLYLAGSQTEMAALAGAFEGRLRERAVPLHMDEGSLSGAAGIRDGLAPLALAAALNT